MRLQLRSIVPVLVLSCAVPTLAEAQLGFPGGVRRSPRPLIGVERPLPGAGVQGDGTGLTWMLGTAGNTGDDASGFSALGGFSLSGKVSMEGTFTYARTIPEGLEGVNAFGGTLEVGVPLPAALARRDFEFSLSGEGEWNEEGDQAYAVGLALGKTLLPGLDLAGSLSYAGDEPDQGGATWALVPGVSASAGIFRNTSVGVDYTFDNDLDGEDSYEFVAKHELEIPNGSTFHLKAGIGHDGKVRAGIIFEL